ncbi:Ankyrin repeat-containing protein OS=Streptomyces microflavus OX=1919 GN=Smic_44460 PE=4 SV=1 [Streptomyces microflavus]
MNALDHDLLTAARTGDTDGVRTAIEGGARVDARDEELRTPLLLAVHGDRVEAARMLVAAGADPDAQDRARRARGWPPASPAASRCCTSCCPPAPT